MNARNSSSEIFELLLNFGKSSFLRIPDQSSGQAPESSIFMTFWIPAYIHCIPQYIEVPPNIEAKRIISYFSAVLCC